MWRNLFIAFSLSFLLAGNACGRSLKVAVASNFQQAAQIISEAFAQQHGIAVDLIPGASGVLYTQIQQGAPYDVFLSADMAYPRALSDRQLASTPKIYAVGQLVLWTPRRQLVSQTQTTTLVIADPQLAPYGRAAHAIISNQDDPNLRIVRAHNINHAFKLIDSGHADGGYIALSQLSFAQALGNATSAIEDFTVIAAEHHPSLEQGATIVANSKQPKLAQKFLTFLLAPEQQAYLYRMGYAQQ